MQLNEYQDKATSTAMFPGQGTFLGLIYCTLKLNGEAGEFAEKVGKCMRDHESYINEERRHAMALELGDVLWYVANSARQLDYTLAEIAEGNIDKLMSRKARDKISGSGDNR